MTEKEQQILMLLQQGKSYSYIQKIVEVSNSKIASVKKLYLGVGSELSNTIFNSATATTILPSTTAVNTESSATTTTDYIESQNELINNLKNKLTMDTDEIFEDDDLDKIKLRLAHDLAVRKLDREDEELNIRKRELQLKEEKATSEERKIEKQGRSLIFRFRKLAEKVKDGEWYHGKIDECSDKATELKEEIEKYCFENEIDTDGLSILIMLNKLETEFESLQDDDAEEDDMVELEFEVELLEMVERAKEVDFESYE